MEINQLDERIKTINGEKEQVEKEGEELRLQLRVSEDAKDATRRDLIETTRLLKENEEKLERQRKECLELKRTINEEKRRVADYIWYTFWSSCFWFGSCRRGVWYRTHCFITTIFFANTLVN